MKGTYKKILKVEIFLLIFSILLYKLVDILWLEKHNIDSFYDEPENTIDVVYIGASTVYRSFNTTLAYDLYGFTTVLLSSGSQPLSAAKHLMKEAGKYQKPYLYIVDIGKVASDLNIPGADIRKVTDAMKWSKDRTDAINEILSYTDIDKKDYVNYKYSFLMYHNAWRSLNITNFEKNAELFKGFTASENTSKIGDTVDYTWNNDDDVMELDRKK